MRPAKRDARCRRSLLIGAAAIGAVSMLTQRALAANDVWVGSTSVNWADLNWTTSNSPAIPDSGDTLEFGAAGSAGLNLIDNLMTPATFNIAGITFDASGGAFVINPGSTGTNGFTLTGTGTITDNDTTAIETIGDSIAGTAGLTLTGGGTLDLTGTNSYTGGTTIAAASLLNINSDAALGAVPGSAGTNITFSGASGDLQAGAAAVILNANRNISLTSATAGSTASFETGANYMAVNGKHHRLRPLD